MNIYVYMIALGMVGIAYFFVWREDRKERKLEEGKPKYDKQQTE